MTLSERRPPARRRSNAQGPRAAPAWAEKYFEPPRIRASLLTSTGLAGWCNGSTADSGSVCHGSNPCRAANSRVAPANNLVRLRRRDGFVKVVVHHHHRRRAATRQALDKFHRKPPVPGGLKAGPMGIQPELPAQMGVQLARSAQGAAQGPARQSIPACGCARSRPAARGAAAQCHRRDGRGVAGQGGGGVVDRACGCRCGGASGWFADWAR